MRDRATFRALATGRRHRRGALTMTRVVTEAGPPRVAFAIGRPVGNAVVRNRVRRRLRALVHERASEFPPGHAYLIGAAPRASTATYGELADALQALLHATAPPS